MQSSSDPLSPAGLRYRILMGDHAHEVVLSETAATVDGRPHDLAVTAIPGGFLLVIDGRSYRVEGAVDVRGAVVMRIDGVAVEATARDPRALLLEQFGAGESARKDEREVRAPMPGLVVKVLVEPGQAVEKGQGLVILEAMKMENELRAPAAGTIQHIHVRSGQAVQKNQALIELGGE